MWAVKVVWDGGGEQPTAFPVAGKSTWHSSAPKTKMFLTVTFWLSYWFWEEGVISFTYAGGWVWLRTTAAGKSSNYKNSRPFSGWTSLLRSQVPQIPFFTHFHCSLFMLYDDSADIFPTVLQLPLRNQKWPVSLHLLRVKGCKSTGYRCTWWSLKPHSFLEGHLV